MTIDIEKILSKIKIIDSIIEILYTLSFLVSSRKPHTSNFQQIKQNNMDEGNDDNLKEKIIQFILNSIKSLFNLMKTMVLKKSNSDKNNLQLINRSINSENLQLNPNCNHKTVVTYIKIFINLFSEYLNSYNSTSIEKEKLKKIAEIVYSFIDLLYDFKQILKLKSSILISIFNIINTNKELFSQIGQDLILKIIFSSISIGWSTLENEAYKLFTETFNMKLRKYHEITIPQQPADKKSLNQINLNEIMNQQTSPKKSEINREIIKFICSNTCIYYMNLSNKNKEIYKILIQLFRFKGETDKLFLDLIKWNNNSKCNRDNLKGEYRSKIKENSSIYINKK